MVQLISILHAVAIVSTRACVWESSGDFVGNVTLHCAEVATGSRLISTNASVPMVWSDVGDAFSVFALEDATSRRLNTDNGSTVYNTTIVAPEFGAYSVVVACGKIEACHVAWGMQWSPGVHHALADATGCSYSGQFQIPGDMTFLCDAVQPGRFTPTFNTTIDAFSVGIYYGSKAVDSECLNDCYSVIAPYSSSRRTEGLQLAHSGTYMISIRCHNHNNNTDRPCTIGIDFNFNTLVPYAQAEADADQTNLTTPSPTTECTVPDSYHTTGMRLTLRANGTFIETTGPDKSGNTCSRSGNFSVSGQAALFTIATMTCNRNFPPNKQLWSLFSFSSDCRRLAVNLTGSTKILWRPSNADTSMPRAAVFVGTLLAYLAFT